MRGAIAQWAYQFVSKKKSDQAKEDSFPIYTPPLYSGGRLGLHDSQGNVEEMIRAFKSIVFACINVRAKEVANRAAFMVKVRTGSREFKDVPFTHPLVELLDNPNPYFTKFYIWYLTIAYLDLTGNSYWWAAKDRLGVPRALWPIPSQYVRIVPGDPSKGEGIIKGYVVMWNAQTITPVDQLDMVHIRYPNPEGPYFYGGSLLMKAAYEVDVLHYIREYDLEFFKNFAMPSFLAVFPDGLDPAVRTAFENQWIDKYHNKPGQMHIAEGKEFHLEQLDLKSSDAHLEAFGLNRKTIQAVFGVPDSKLMLTENIESRATVETMDYIFQKETIDPLLTMIDQQMTTDMARPLFDEKLVVMHNSTIPKDLVTQAALDASNTGAGIDSINEIRKRDGKEPFAGGDEPLVLINKIPLSQAASAPGTGPEPPPVVPPKRKLLRLKDMTEAKKTAAWKSHDRFRARWELKLTKVLKDFFRKIEADILKQLASRKSIKAEDGNSVSGQFVFDAQKWLKQLQPLISAQALAVMEAAFKEFNDTYGIEGQIFTPNNPDVTNGLSSINAKTVTIPATLHDELQEMVDESMRMNETVDELASRVSRFFDNTTDYRAVRIARTTSNFAVNAGNAVAAEDAGFDVKAWLTMRDDRVRDIHVPMDGVQVMIGEKFQLPNGDSLNYPGDPAGRAESVVNCRCTVFFSKGKQ